MKTIVLWLLCFCVFGLASTQAQGRTDGLPISVKVNTPANFEDGYVEIAGTTFSVDNEPALVFIEIIKPEGGTDNLKVRADKKTSEFRINYIPKEVGEYKVIAYASDKQQTANTTFTVTLSIEMAEDIKAFDSELTKTNVALDKALNNLAAEQAPEDAAKTKEKTGKLKKSVKEFEAHWGGIKKSLADLQTLIKKYPGINSIAAGELGKLSSQLEQSSDILKQVQKSVGQSKGDQADICNRLYQVSEGCAAFSTFMNITSGGILKIGAAIFIDKVWPKIEEAQAEKLEAKKNIKLSATDNLVFKQAGKAGLTALDGLKELQTTSFGAGMAGDLVQFFSDEQFKKYCTEYKGPISGDYTLEFRNNGKMYMRYKVTYTGKMSLYCETTKLKGNLPKFNGYLEGNVTNMEFTDDVWAIEDKSEWDEIKYQRIPAVVPPVNLSKEDPGFGAAARAAMPGAFYFPLTAQMVQGKMVIKLLPALSDFTEAMANRSIVVARAKYGAQNISGGVFTYPFTTARFMLTRSMRMPDSSPTVTLDMNTKNGTTTMEKKFARTETPEDTRVDFNFQLKMSNEK